VKVEGRHPKPGLALASGDQVFCKPPAAVPSQALPEDLPVRIVYEDQDLAVVDKPAGLVTHPAVGHASGTLVNALLHHLRDLSGVGGEQRPGIVHRLDKDTSGLLLVAKNDPAHRALALAIQERRVSRSYDTVVWGRIQEETFTLETFLGRDPRNRKRFAVVSHQGKTAVTHFSVTRRFSEFTGLRIKLETGRTHQIRVHCRYLDKPVVGDRDYGKRSEAALLSRLHLPRPERQLLHASRLEFLHPLTQAPLAFTSGWPADFAEFMQALETKGS
jgi:23S rRNA pseudouridine1911/1915/1917 synthase